MIINIDMGTLSPERATEIAKLTITALTPAIVLLVKQIRPNLPKGFLPAATPVIGVLFGIVLERLGIQDLTMANTAAAGGLGVMVREVYDQFYGKKADAAKEALEYKPKAESKVEPKRE